MPLVDPYCTLQALQKETANSDTEQEAWFETCINNASRWIDDYCHRDFLLHDYSASPYYTVPDEEFVGGSIFLKWPILTLTEITSADMVIDTTAYTFVVGKRELSLRDGSHWITRHQPRIPGLSYGMGYEVAKMSLNIPIVLKGTFGFTSVPMAIQQACCRIAAAWSQQKRREKVNLEGARTSLLDDRIPDDSMALLKRYRLLVY